MGGAGGGVVERERWEGRGVGKVGRFISGLAKERVGTICHTHRQSIEIAAIKKGAASHSCRMAGAAVAAG